MKKDLMRLQQGNIVLGLRQSMYFLALAFVPLFLKNQGFSMYSLMLIFAVLAGIAMILIALVNTIRIKKFLIASFLSYFVMSMFLAFSSPQVSFYSYIILEGSLLLIFWVPLNYIYFETSLNNTNARDSTIYFAMFGALAIVLPPIGSLLINILGFQRTFLLCGLFSFLPLLYVTKYTPEKVTKQSFSDCMKNFQGIRTVTFIEGALGFMRYSVVPVYALLFLNTEFEFGGFMSYLGLIGLIVALAISGKSDKNQERMKYLSPMLYLMGLSVLSLAYDKNLTLWLVLVGIYMLLDYMSSPLRLSIILDAKDIDVGFWRAREFFLNFGRVVIIGICALLFYYGYYQFVFVLFGVITLLYPLAAKRVVLQ